MGFGCTVRADNRFPAVGSDLPVIELHFTIHGAGLTGYGAWLWVEGLPSGRTIVFRQLDPISHSSSVADVRIPEPEKFANSGGPVPWAIASVTTLRVSSGTVTPAHQSKPEWRQSGTQGPRSCRHRTGLSQREGLSQPRAKALVTNPPLAVPTAMVSPVLIVQAHHHSL